MGWDYYLAKRKEEIQKTLKKMKNAQENGKADGECQPYKTGINWKQVYAALDGDAQP